MRVSYELVNTRNLRLPQDSKTVKHVLNGKEQASYRSKTELLNAAETETDLVFKFNEA